MNEGTEILPDMQLRLHIEHPSLEECYVYGYECAVAGIGEEENPHLERTREYDYWSDGWWDGFFHEKPAYSLEGPYEDFEGARNYTMHSHSFGVTLLKITSILVVTAVVGYQLLDLVA